MATLSTVALLLKDLYRLLGTTSSDGALVENSESADDVGYLCLTHGIWRAQHFLIRNGMQSRWLTRSSAITWSGTESADGGRYTALASDVLRLAGDRDRSALVRADGDVWGTEIDFDQRHYKGHFYYLMNDRLWITRGASPPSPIYYEYHARHAEVVVGLGTIDFPVDARPLIVSEAADYGHSQGWFLRDTQGIAAIKDRLETDRREAREIARRTRSPRRFKVKPMIGTRFF